MPFVSVRIDTPADLVRWLECGYPLHEVYDTSFDAHNTHQLRGLIVQAVIVGALPPRLSSAFLRRVVAEELQKRTTGRLSGADTENREFESTSIPLLQTWIAAAAALRA